jgi:hypothetical protein
MGKDIWQKIDPATYILAERESFKLVLENGNRML